MKALIDWLYDTQLSEFVNGYAWAWPVCETLHFCGLTLLAGTVGLLDLRILGVAKGLSPAALHRSLRWGMLGFAVSVATGITFIAGASEQYFYNSAFHFKVMFLVLMGANAAWFYWREFASVRALGPYDDAEPSTKIVAGLSLFFLAAVMCCGRMLTFFRPPF